MVKDKEALALVERLLAARPLDPPVLTLLKAERLIRESPGDNAEQGLRGLAQWRLLHQLEGPNPSETFLFGVAE